jgi:hypothetical protein
MQSTHLVIFIMVVGLLEVATTRNILIDVENRLANMTIFFWNIDNHQHKAVVMKC